MRSRMALLPCLWLAACGSNITPPPGKNVSANNSNTLLPGTAWQELNPSGVEYGTSWDQSILHMRAANGKLYATADVSPGTNYKGYTEVYETSDMGANWASHSFTTPQAYASENYWIYDLLPSPADPNVFYSFDNFGNILSTNDDFTTIALDSPPVNDPTYGLGIEFIPRIVNAATGAIFATSYTGILKSTSGATHWSVVYNANQQGSYGPMVTDPADANRYLAGLGSHIVLSANAGASWQAASLVGDANNQINSLAFDGNHNLFAATSQGVFRSSDGGSSFTHVSAVDNAITVKHVQGSADSIYVLFESFDLSGGVSFLVTQDAGLTWFNAFPALANANLVSPCETSLEVDSSGDVFFSLGHCGPLFVSLSE